MHRIAQTDRQTDKTTMLNDKSWVFLVGISIVFFVSGMLSLVKAQKNIDDSIVNNIGVSATILMSFVGTIISAVFLTVGKDWNISRGFFALFQEKSMVKGVLPWAIGFGILFFLGNVFFFKGLTSAPNAGYARAVMSIEVVAMTLLSGLLFGSSISWSALVGIALIISGVSLVSVQ